MYIMKINCVTQKKSTSAEPELLRLYQPIKKGTFKVSKGKLRVFI